MAFREIGKDYSALETFCGIMNKRTPMNVKAFNEIQLKNEADAYIKVSKTAMTDAAEEKCQGNIQERDSEDSLAFATESSESTSWILSSEFPSSESPVSYDGTW